MNKTILKFGNVEVKKNAFYKFKYPIDIDKVGIEEKVIFNKIWYVKKGFNYFIGYKEDEEGKPLSILLPKMSGYIKCFDEANYMYFLVEDKKLLKVYDKIRDKISNIMQKGFDSEPIYNERYLKTKTKPYDSKININFYDNGAPGPHSVLVFQQY